MVAAGPQLVICDDCVSDAAELLSTGPVARWLREVGEAEYRSWVANQT